MSEKISNLSCVYVNSEIDTYDKFKTMFMNFDNDEYLIHLPVKYKHMIYEPFQYPLVVKDIFIIHWKQ